MKYNKVTLKFGKKEFVWQYCPRPIAKVIVVVFTAIWSLQNFRRIGTLVQLYGQDTAMQMLKQELGIESVDTD